jgi:Ino eighty subunit 2
VEDEEGAEGEEDAEEDADGDADADVDADVDADADVDVDGDASPSKMTARQRSRLGQTGELLALPGKFSSSRLMFHIELTFSDGVQSKAKPILTEAERLQKREEMARRRKRQNEQRLQDEQVSSTLLSNHTQVERPNTPLSTRQSTASCARRRAARAPSSTTRPPCLKAKAGARAG